MALVWFSKDVSRGIFYGKLAALLNFRKKFITNDGPDHLWGPH
jgi:hypothetical protein